jgi:hypothetical protein
MRLHLDQVDDARKRILRADGQVERHAASAHFRLHLPQCL